MRAIAGALGGAAVLTAALLTTGLPAAAQSTFNPVIVDEFPNPNFDVIVRGNATLLNSEAEGSIAIGGDLTLGGQYRVNLQGYPADNVPGLNPAKIGLLVNGKVDWGASAANGTLTVLNDYMKIGNLAGSSVYDKNTNPSSSLTRVTAAGAGINATQYIVNNNNAQTAATVGLQPGETLPDFDSAFTTFRARSIGLGLCGNNGVNVTDGNGNPLPPGVVIPPDGKVRISLTPGIQNVWDLTAAQFAALTEMNFPGTVPSPTTPLIVNITGSTVTWPQNMNTPPLSRTNAPYILWNMPDASKVIRNPGVATVEGTIYAPQADLINTDSANIEGNIVAATLDRDGGEYHHAPFDAQLTACGVPTSASLDMTKSVSPSTVGSAGSTVTYSFTVTNNGSVTVSGIAIVEDYFSGHGSISTPQCNATTLPAGESTTCTATYTLDQTDIDNGQVTNTAHAAGTGGVDSPTSSATVTVGKVKTLTMIKSVSPATVSAAGDTVTYRFLVTNTGNETVSEIFIDEVAFSGTGTAPAISCPTTQLLPRASTTCTATYTMTKADIQAGKVTNTAHAVGTEPDQTIVLSPDDTATVTARVKPAPKPVPVPVLPVTG